MKSALLLVDLQNDFMPTGTLPVPDADLLIPIVNQLQKHFELIIATQDWHPKNHQSFAINHIAKKPFDIVDLNGLEQMLWPVHCVQNTKSAEFVAELDMARVNKIIQKGTDWEVDSYSAFFDNGQRKKTDLAAYLKQQNVTDVYICGVATDFCVKYTAMDAIKLDFKTYVIANACRGMDTAQQALEDMRKAGVKIVSSVDCVKKANSF